MLDQGACRMFWIRRLHPYGPGCPGCGISVTGRQSETFNAGGRVRCNTCGQWFTYRTGTLIDGAKADDRQLFQVAQLSTLDCDLKDISTASHLSTDTVRAWQRRFHEAAGL